MAKAIDIAHGAGIDKVGLMSIQGFGAIGGFSETMRKAILILVHRRVGAFRHAAARRPKARDQLDKGVAAFKNAQYPEAVEHFNTAVDLDQNFPTVRLYLATAYMQQYIPGADSQENKQFATAAHDQFLQVLDMTRRTSWRSLPSPPWYLNQNSSIRRRSGTKS